MPFERTAVTEYAYIYWIKTSPDAISLIDSSKLFQNARNWPAFLASIRTPIVLSISALVMLPLSPYLISPIDSQIIAASMMPIDEMLRIDALPLYFGSSICFHWVIGSLTRSGRMPSVSALKIVGIRLNHWVGCLENVFASLPVRKLTLIGAVPWVEAFLPSGISPRVKIGTTLSNSLMRVMSIGCRLPVGTSLGS